MRIEMIDLRDQPYARAKKHRAENRETFAKATITRMIPEKPQSSIIRSQKKTKDQREFSKSGNQMPVMRKKKNDA